MEDVVSIFHRYDKDRSGDIDATELRAALNDLSIKADAEDARRVLKSYDGDNSGKIEVCVRRERESRARLFPPSPFLLLTAPSLPSPPTNYSLTNSSN